MSVIQQIPWRGIVIGGLVLLAGTITAAVVESDILPALVAAVVLLVLLAIDDQLQESEE
ncbi:MULTISPECIES: hypothetical protein [Salinibaculum]|uniref:hypothetical protein n=1 Tax=Salinibaculum TaxID=2732368 RepID=UPI0030CE2AF0